MIGVHIIYFILSQRADGREEDNPRTFLECYLIVM